MCCWRPQKKHPPRKKPPQEKVVLFLRWVGLGVVVVVVG